MPGERDSPDVPALRARVSRLMPAWRAHDLGDFAYLPKGYSNDNYRFRHQRERYVLRLPIRARMHAQWRSERAFYQAPGDIAVPDVLAFDIGSGAMISRWVDGPLMIDAPPATEHLISFLRSLQKNLAAAANPYDPIAQSRQALQTPGPDQPSSRVQRLVSRSKWPQTHLVACHNDFNPWNVICAPNDRWVTLDWESRGNNDPLFDLVTMHQGLALPDDLLPGLCDDLIGQRTAPGRIELVLMGFWIREYAWAFAERQRGNYRDELRAQMQLAESKLSAIDR